MLAWDLGQILLGFDGLLECLLKSKSKWLPVTHRCLGDLKFCNLHLGLS